MLCPAETDAFCSKPQSVCRVFRRIRIGAYIQFAEGVGPFHDPFEIAADRGILGCDIAVINARPAGAPCSDLKHALFHAFNFSQPPRLHFARRRTFSPPVNILRRIAFRYNFIY